MTGYSKGDVRPSGKAKDQMGRDLGIGKGIAADYGFRWYGIASNMVRQLLGFNQRHRILTSPKNNFLGGFGGWKYFQEIANELPNGYSAGRVGLDRTQYPVPLREGGIAPEIAAFAQDLMNTVRGLKDGFNDLLTTGLGRALAGNQDPGKAGPFRPPQGPFTYEQHIKPNATFVSVPKKRFNQFLENRGFLKVVYPDGGSGDEPTKLILPFYENPEIAEDRQARYASVPIFNRNEPLRLWTGADARKLTVQFKYTTPHIMALALENDLPHLGLDTDAAERAHKILVEDIKKFNKDIKNHPDNQARLSELTDSTVDTSMTQNARSRLDAMQHSADSPTHSGYLMGRHNRWQFASTDINQIIKNEAYKPGDPNNPEAPFGYDGRSYGHDYLMRKEQVQGQGGDGYKKYFKMLGMVHAVINVIRTSVVGSVEEPFLGPPIVRLTFGSLYRNVPCICKNYSFGIDQSMGYDNDSLIPRSVSIKLELEEYRQGVPMGMEQYDPTTDTGKDGLPGWNDYLAQGSMDPPSDDAEMPSTSEIENYYNSKQ